MNQKTIFNVAVVLVAVAGIYILSKKVGGSDNSAKIDYLKTAGFASGNISSFAPEFIDDWASAAKRGDEFFKHGEKVYRVKGGRAV